LWKRCNEAVRLHLIGELRCGLFIPHLNSPTAVLLLSMAQRVSKVVIVGGGCFGASAALELRHRGYHVTVVDELSGRGDGDGVEPHDLASSTDNNKLIRPDYGDDVFYTELMRQSFDQQSASEGNQPDGRYLPGWHQWNEFFGENLYHETGLLIMDRNEIESEPNGFTAKSLAAVQAAGMRVDRVRQETLRATHPAWNSANWRDGYINRVAGWADSGRVVRALLHRAAACGVEFHRSHATSLVYEGTNRVVGIVAADGTTIRGDMVVVSAGAWTTSLVPWLARTMWPVAQFVHHFEPLAEDVGLFDGDNGTFPAWTAAIRETGFYGFPIHPQTGYCKVGHHGSGFSFRGSQCAPTRQVLASIKELAGKHEEARFRAFVQETFPKMALGKTAFVRICLYCDTLNGDFLIDQDPEHPGLVVAAGGSGHAFKFTPVLGAIIADAVQGKVVERFRWRITDEYKLDSARTTNDVDVHFNQQVVRDACQSCADAPLRTQNAKL
jgi:sarcosine oxidase / L-pipecolate oxidase